MSGFAQLIPEARGFLSDLAAHNDRAWLSEHKPAYEAKVSRPAKLFLDEMEHWLATGLSQPTAPKMYRIHRDLRFSKDKTPYNTHLHLEWRQITGAPIGFFFGVSPSYCKLGVGTFAFSKEALLKWRDAVDQSDQIAERLQGLQAKGWIMEAPELKRIPAPYEKDHRHGALLRRKGVTLWRDLDEADQNDPLQTLKTHFTDVTDLRRALSAALA
ncbi:MAG: TIGR02453 family protein [Maritimibacter sp.]